jgi:glutamate/tyrosine decarboxylase-like PLP-dependent enzyme
MHRRYTAHPTSTAWLREAPGHLTTRLPRFRPPHDDEEGRQARIASMFLGPRAEQADLLQELMARAVSHVADFRRSYLPGDPKAVTKDRRTSPEYLAAVDRLRTEFQVLLDRLEEHATPYFSSRYQGHMLHDTLLPGILGYVATMLHNPNNVTVQASTLTTFLELLVGWDLCTMIGFPFEPEEPWGHITADGSVANLEAAWSARELRLFPVAVRAAVQDALDQVGAPGWLAGVTEPTTDDRLTQALADHARRFEVHTTIRGRQPLLDASTWDLTNLAMADALALPTAMAETMTWPAEHEAALWGRLLSFAPNTLGLFTFYKRYMRGVADTPVILAPRTKHYSWPKAAAVLGLGDGPLSVIDIDVDADARMDVEHLRLVLDKLVALRRPVALVVGVMGSTEEGACDDLGRVLEVREEFRRKGLEFNVHADAAWGGYFVSTLRADFTEPGEGCEAPFIEDQSQVHLNAHTRRAFERLREADSVTIDPHKMGFVQYPAGALCYRDSRLRNMVTFGAPVIGTPGSQISVGEFGIEGSKPGAAPAAVYLAHAVVRPSTSGYGQLINEVLRSAKAFYLRIATLAEPDDPFVCVPLPRLPSQRDGRGDDSQWEGSIEDLSRLPVEEILREPALLERFNELGPDQNIVDYVFNLRLPDGSINRDLDMCRKLNTAVYDAFHVHEGTMHGHQTRIDFGRDVQEYPLIISQTQMSPDDYGSVFINDYLERLGLDLPPASADATIRVNRTVVMDPWLWELRTADGRWFLDETMALLRAEVLRVAHELRGDG